MTTAGLPRITVVTPSFNQAAYLERTILSVLEQGYPNLEYFVMDGGSTDGSVDIIQRYAGRIDFWTSRPDGGQSAAINAGWRRATGDVLAWLNSDDYYLPGALPWIGAYLAAHPSTWVAYGPCQNVDAEGRPLGLISQPFRRRTMILSHNVICQPGSFIRREAIEAVGLLDEQLRYTMDLDFFLRVARHREPVFVNRPLAAATVHADAKTLKDRGPMGRERYEVRRRHARLVEQSLVLLQPLASRAFHLLPSGARRAVEGLRPRRSSPDGDPDRHRP